MNFEIVAKDAKTKARVGILTTRHGKINTPCFIPDATLASVKYLTAKEVAETGIELVLCNLYHLWLRPGFETIEKLGGLHKFMCWKGPIITDSGGFQVYSLIHRSGLGGKIKEEGALFRSHLDGREMLLTPESSVNMQYRMGSDILLPLDESVPGTAPKQYFEKSIALTIRWAKRSKVEFERLNKENDRLLFGIVQGGVYQELLKESAKKTVDIGFDGYALGGVAVGLESTKLHEVIGYSLAELPEDKPRYMLGIGYPKEILRAVEEGVDFFDCVIPTRNARHGMLFTKKGPINIRSGKYALADEPIDERCNCFTCQNFSKAYVSHLLKAKEPLGPRLATIHNLQFYASMIGEIREAIKQGKFSDYARQILAYYP